MKKKITLVRIIAMATLLVACAQVFIACKDSNEDPAPVPTILGFTPASAMEGTDVVITGTNFSTTASANVVKFNGVAATVTAATATNITATVPNGATTGKITVEVGTETGVSADDFTVIGPTITGFTPATALAGASVVIKGANFGPAAIVKFNGLTAAITNLTATQITATVPANVTNGKITVQVGTRTATSVDDFTLLVLPTVASFTAFGPIGKTITVIGTKFDLTKTNNVVSFNGVPAVVSEATSTQLKAVVPYGATTGSLTITVNGTDISHTQGNFTVTSSWTQNASSFPGVERYSEFSYAAKGKGYVGGGFGNNNWRNDFYEFDPTGNGGAGSWQQKTSLFAGGIYASTSFVVQSLGLVIDGDASVFFYQGGNVNSWSYNGSVAVDNGVADYVTAFVINDLAYIKNIDGAVTMYDYSINNSGNAVAAYPEGTSSYQSAFTIGNTAYVGGGNESYSTNVPFNSFYSFTAVDGWIKRNNLPVTGVVTMFTVEETGYLKQGRAIYRYEQSNDSWTRLEDAPASMENSGATFVIGSKAYIGLSSPGSTGATQLWEFVPSK